MKIVSYNINGLNAFVKNGKLDELLKTIPADIYCFQEVKADYDKIDKLLSSNEIINSNYTWLSSPSIGKKGYAGVTILFRNEFSSMIDETFIENMPVMVTESGNTIDHTYTSGRIVGIEFEDFILINVYVVNSGNKDEIRKEFDKFLQEDLKTFYKPYIICGDFNVCATELDYWGNYKKQINSGPGLMQYEIDGMKSLMENIQLVDVYRELNPDKRAYTWYSPQHGAINRGWGWRIDYFLASKELIPMIKNSKIYEKFQGADHCPIELEINEDMNN